MPVKEAWINIDGDRITVGAKCDNPILDGEISLRLHDGEYDGYSFSRFPKRNSNDLKCHHYANRRTAEIYTTKNCDDLNEDGKPKSLIFTCLDYAISIIPEFVARLSASAMKSRNEVSKDWRTSMNWAFVFGLSERCSSDR